MYKKFAILILMTVIISGCVGDGDSGGPSVSGNKETKSLQSDFLKINSFEIIPAEELTTERPFVLRLEVDNIGNNHVNLTVDKFDDYDGDMILYDICTGFNLERFKMTPSHEGNPDIIEVKPGALQFFEWKMRTPADDIVSDAGISCDFNVQLSYDAIASTNTYVYFATPFEILRSFYTRKNMYLLGSNLATDGPLKININPDSQQPIAMDNNAWTVSINMENVGDGLAEVKSLELVLPDEIDTAGSMTIDGEDICNLEKAENLEIYKKGSQVITCMFTPPNEDVLIATAYKIKAVAEYTYTIKDSVQLSVKPLI